ncbi:GNAT family N-acetyltransferase [Curtobacterium sp. RRHDQ10]|uniref:GNAT family N-acetyltransferase n=1 Tax=Curtobacterium phyllosphaerae TaxID=3413379 RepID=UPI003BF1658F
MTSLADRVVAPAHLATPSPIDGVVFRPATREDIPAMHRVLLAACAADTPDFHPAQEDIDNEFSTTGLDPRADTIVGHDAAGHVIAYAFVMVHPSHETLVRVWLPGAVDPQYRSRGIGRRLLAWQLGRSRQQLAAIDVDLPAQIELTDRAGAPALALALRFGMEPTRFWFELERDLADPVDVPGVPDGYLVRAYAPDDLEPTRLAKNDSFRDHWGSQPTLAADWARARSAPSFRPDLSRVVVDASGAVVAFAITEVDPDSFAARGGSYGYVDYVGVVRAHRGRGLAPAVLASALGGIRADGLTAAVLDVDADNPTGALGLYERLGFVRGTVAVTHTLQY